MKNPKTNQTGSIPILSNGVNNKPARHEELPAAQRSGERQGGPGDQAFIVEWQMHSNKAAEVLEKSQGKIETRFYLH